MTGSIFARPDAFFVTIAVLLRGSTAALETHHFMSGWAAGENAVTYRAGAVVRAWPTRRQSGRTPTTASTGTPASGSASLAGAAPAGSTPTATTSPLST